MLRLVTTLLVAAIALLAMACKKEISTQNNGNGFMPFKKPTNFPEPNYDLAQYPVTEAGFMLGRRLFYDGLLSRNGTISCGSCHEQGSAFTHHGHDISHGIDDRLGRRNSPPLMNLAWHKEFMWDGGVNHLDLQPIAPITAHEEMDEDLGNVLQKLRNHPAYPTLFKAAYGNDSITTSRFLKALSQFMNMLISDNSKYDKVMRGEGGTSFTQEEQEGYALFKEHCAACHTEPLFTNLTYADNGLGATPNDDKGRYEITLRPEDLYTFKIPSLRNSMLTAPYMHNGSIRNMDGVLEHYTTGLQASPNLHPLLKNPATGQPQPIALNATQKQQLKAFLNTLSDEAFIRNKIFSEP